MTFYEIECKVQHNCPYTDLTRQMPDLVFAHWCNHKRDVLEVSCEDQALSTFENLQSNLGDLERLLGVKIFRKSFGSNYGQLVTRGCVCTKLRKAVGPFVEKHNCLRMQPIFYKQGWEWYRILAFNQNDIKNLFADLEKFCNVQIVSRHSIENTSVRDSFIISTSSLIGELTKKQAFALLTAISMGYYEVPKKISTEGIAERLALPRTTYEEHLRKAESKVLRAMTPLLELGDSALRAAPGFQQNGKLRKEIVIGV